MGEARVRPAALTVSEKRSSTRAVAMRLGLLDGDLVALDGVLHRIRAFPARRDLAREGDPPRAVYAVLEGWVCRYKTLPDGRRQILGFLLPGDLCDSDMGLAAARDHSLGAINAVTAAEIAPVDLEEAMAAHPGLAREIRRNALVAASIQREWTLNLGQRSAYERIAHLLCETFARLHVVGLAGGESCEFPITQTDLAEATGLTAVHVNRTLQALRAEGLVELHGRRLRLPDLPRLIDAASFSDDYLHLRAAGGHKATDD